MASRNGGHLHVSPIRALLFNGASQPVFHQGGGGHFYQKKSGPAACM
jgi:hypothetical protein